MTCYLHHVTQGAAPQTLPIHDPRLGLTDMQASWPLYERFMGFHTIAYQTKKTMADLLITALQQLIETSDLCIAHIDTLIHCHTHAVVSPIEQPHLDALLAHFPDLHCPCFGMTSNQCASYIAALSMAEDLGGNTVILCADVVLTHAERCIPNTALMGECVTATWISDIPHTDPAHVLRSTHRFSEGRYADGIYLSAAEQQHFATHYLDHMQHLVETTLQKAQRTLKDLQWMIPHHVNAMAWQRLITRLGLPAHCIDLSVMGRYGHCFNADLSLHWAHSAFHQRLQDRDHYMMVTVGMGGVFAAALWQYHKHLPTNTMREHPARHRS